MCVDCVLASLRIAQDDPGRWTPSLRWFCHTCKHHKPTGREQVGCHGQDKCATWPHMVPWDPRPFMSPGMRMCSILPSHAGFTFAAYSVPYRTMSVSVDFMHTGVVIWPKENLRNGGGRPMNCSMTGKRPRSAASECGGRCQPNVWAY
jgi:hypothetical protein